MPIPERADLASALFLLFRDKEIYNEDSPIG